ncbi:ATP-dependent acyl-CoA ligase [Amycolatopsis sp. NPDC051903]|uniref:ATP-dependent acyl-CoA ligase n=1 Tax=Amycolatopsis sp. NPDC051903 TaxID=3363936 RepID=UPI0037A794F4
MSDAVTARVEQVTEANGVRVATLRTGAGDVVVGRLDGAEAPGDDVRVTAAPSGPGTAWVPAGHRLPDRAEPARALWPATCTVPRLLTRQAEVHGDRPLVVCGAVTWTYRDTADRAARAAGMLQRRGVVAGDRVALLCGNRLELLEIVLGCAWLGAIAVPLNTAVRGAGLRHTLADSGASVLVAEPHLVTALEGIDVPETLAQIWVLDGPDHPVPADPVPPADAAPGDTVAILYTSGTTGLPKGVCCPHAQFFWFGVTVAECLELEPADVLYTCLPLFHINALTAFFQALVTGARIVYGERFSVSRYWTEAEACGATVTYLLGAMVQLLLAAPESERDSAHAVRIALSPATPTASHEPFRERFGVRLIEGYASTETNMMVGAHARSQRPGWMGVVLPDYEARVVDPAGLDVPDGEAGELVCRSRLPFAFATGYFGNPAATAAAWHDLWFHTGDRVVRDGAGWLRFVDRVKDSIRRRGENISSMEVEQVLAAHPAVAAVAVFAVPSELAEDEVMGAVVRRADITPLELVQWCEPRLSYFAIPRYVDFVDDLPLTENGKVRKAVLRSRGVTGGTWDREAAGYRLRR